MPTIMISSIRRFKLKTLVGAFIVISGILCIYVPSRDVLFQAKRWRQFGEGRDFGPIRSLSIGLYPGTISTMQPELLTAFRMAALKGRPLLTRDKSQHKNIFWGTRITVKLENGGTLSGDAVLSDRGFVVGHGDSRKDDFAVRHEFVLTHNSHWTRFLEEVYRSDYDATLMNSDVIKNWHVARTARYKKDSIPKDPISLTALEADSGGGAE